MHSFLEKLLIRTKIKSMAHAHFLWQICNWNIRCTVLCTKFVPGLNIKSEMFPRQCSKKNSGDLIILYKMF